jgi:Hint domain
MRVIFGRGGLLMTNATTETFRFAYELSSTYVDGAFQYKIVDPVSKTSTVEPAATGVTLKDPDGGLDGGVLHSGETARVAKATDVSYPFDPGNYSFVGTANVEDHGTTITGLVIEDAGGHYFFLTDTQYTGNVKGKSNGDVTITGYDTTLGSGTVGGGICFAAGTLIRTPDGQAAVETLKCGDHVLTQDGRIATVDWLGIQTISMRFADKLRVLPIRIRAGAVGENVPSRDLLVSPDHAILVEGALIQAGALVNGTPIVRETNVPMTFKYYHVEVEDHSLILAENTPAETFVDNVERLAFDNWAEHEALYPDGKPITELPYPRAKSHRQVPVSTRVLLAARAEAMGFAATAVA